VLSLRGEQDHRHVLVLARAAHHLQAVHPRHHQVEHHEVGTALAGDAQRVRAVAGDACAVARALEVARDDIGDGRLVIHDEDGAAWIHAFDCASAPASGPAV